MFYGVFIYEIMLNSVMFAGFKGGLNSTRFSPWKLKEVGIHNFII